MPWSNGIRHAWLVARKDLLVEFRSRTAILSALAVLSAGRALSAKASAPSQPA